jgi:hypothetical protein
MRRTLGMRKLKRRVLIGGKKLMPVSSDQNIEQSSDMRIEYYKARTKSDGSGTFGGTANGTECDATMTDNDEQGTAM